MKMFDELSGRLKLPLMVAPMLRISGPELVSECCINGVIGSFPTVNARTPEGLEAWIIQIKESIRRSERPSAPFCANILVRSSEEMLKADLKILAKHRVEMVLASTGAPGKVIGPMHDAGCLVIADVASIRHAEKAIEQGADGLALLTAGAGGQTGWANGLAFVRAVRSFYDGPVILAGGISDGHALWAARVLGCDLGLMGTRFIATAECAAVEGYKSMLVDSRLDDIALTRGISGIDANFLRPSIVACGLDPVELAAPVSPERAREMFSSYAGGTRGPKRWSDLWSAGHTVSGVKSVRPVEALINDLQHEYSLAQQQSERLIASSRQPTGHSSNT
jgi:nitronate monooxygenase